MQGKLTSSFVERSYGCWRFAGSVTWVPHLACGGTISPNTERDVNDHTVQEALFYIASPQAEAARRFAAAIASFALE